MEKGLIMDDNTLTSPPEDQTEAPPPEQAAAHLSDDTSTLNLSLEVMRAGFRLSPDIVPLSDPRSPQAESIGALRSHLMAQHIRDGRRSLAVCAAEENVGSTFLSVNLAVAFALAGTRTLLIDANMRDPGLARFIQPSQTLPGLMDYLAREDAGSADIMQEDVIPHLSVIYAGSGNDNPQELLAGRKFKELVNEGMRNHDITIVDTPPAGHYPDYLRIAVVVRYALIVARKNHTRLPAIKAMGEQLLGDRVKLVGSFLNEF